jgi:hypothetical protein
VSEVVRVCFWEKVRQRWTSLKTFLNKISEGIKGVIPKRHSLAELLLKCIHFS